MFLKIPKRAVLFLCFLTASAPAPAHAAAPEHISVGILIGTLTGYGAAKAEELFESNEGHVSTLDCFVLWWLEKTGRARICGAASGCKFLSPLRVFFQEIKEACSGSGIFNVGRVAQPFAEVLDMANAAWLASWTSYLITRSRHKKKSKQLVEPQNSVDNTPLPLAQ